ncbi:dihydropteroate synthase [Hydrogenophaga crassostreae]|uniref:Dihydropteroate synthase n=1 Tax=Hydrogenophaga crassostreae TaxID=1763535 RepID=A0A167HUL2_9BURK|nr:dihydropteroate synthase [Hydrogenophaga crassostreae]AOW13465.1 dihydropteroate synthase [Hydrogenophaga crassostreae]OAD41756.1 dihydropteroate synthase [Hydrogenophaga crassostreae]
MIWQTTRFQIDLSQPRVMGIVNVTPDSFSDGGAHASLKQALRHAETLIEEGADILDIGGESTRPGSPPVPLEAELARVLPLVRELVKLGIPISIDTYKPEVMEATLDLGVDIINDVWALRQRGAEAVVAGHPSCGTCLMHMHRDPQSMQVSPMEGVIVGEVAAFLQSRAQRMEALGVHRARIVLDPGVGFGKSVAQNFSLLSQQSELLKPGYPLLVGWSRKSSLGAVTGVAEPARRVTASVAAALLAAVGGARLLRVHDVSPTVEALAVFRAMQTH